MQQISHIVSYNKSNSWTLSIFLQSKHCFCFKIISKHEIQNTLFSFFKQSQNTDTLSPIAYLTSSQPAQDNTHSVKLFDVRRSL